MQPGSGPGVGPILALTQSFRCSTMTKQDVENALDHAVDLGFIESWDHHVGGQIRYRPVRGFQGAGHVVVRWKEAARYLAEEGLFDPETGDTLTA